ncbi:MULTISPECIES: hypothetical protein [Pseudomonas]|uniref:Uncharacterized protein n=1 Tax=Pseudomonas soli TaxID=1306993 RepID=A0A2V4IAB1_9PSED|nr:MULTISPECIES: hypothetical protein [Pseudomonas]PYB86429.1 hypothetical protein DMX07_01165 [Pseudomonas soli]PZW84998.1 hypothetical protein DFS21_102229 [Pseudomonas sp. 2848]
MTVNRLFLVLMLAFGIQGAAYANQAIFTAHISDDGTILNQSPQWITQVERRVQTDYLTEYTISLKKKVTQGDPGYCAMSPIDNSQYERVIYGQGKVIGKPRADKVIVATQLVDVNGPSGDNSLAFQLLCVR